ncbi:MAG: site-specific DNA-methyltransferase [Gammaproteobacteria bacterium]|nr:site-specific DNA-methyltransferase [Gammaproteobacteria bacterium]
MANNKQKLELTWIGKEKRPRLEPRILLEEPEFSYQREDVDELATGETADLFAHNASGDGDGDGESENENDGNHPAPAPPSQDNILIHGDNLLALKALEQQYAGKVKCVFIDPPYNTGSAFTHYDDGVEHSMWLTLIRDRLEIIKNLLSEDGSLWITIDDNECHYLKVLCDEVFGRRNFLTSLTWVKRVSPANDAKLFSSDHDHVLIYSKSKNHWSLNRLDRSAKHNSSYKNPDGDHRGPWNSVTYTGNKSLSERPNLHYAITNPTTGEQIYPPKTLTWRYGHQTHLNNEQNDLLYWGKDGKSKNPRLKKFLSDATAVVPRSVWHHAETGSTQTGMTEQKTMFDTPFATPKPEKLLERIIHIATNPGDLVLDSFAGSGTTGAVAHKMGRRWIMVELGDHCKTHIVPRLKKVIDGDDQGGISKAMNWKGGGGYKFYRVAPSLLKKDKWGNWVINPEYNGEMLSEAMCKHMGYAYGPSPDLFWLHGQASENNYIYVTTGTLSHEQLAVISDEVGDERSLLICSKGFMLEGDEFANLSLKKIPQAVLHKCEWDQDDYSFHINVLPEEEDIDDLEDTPLEDT